MAETSAGIHGAADRIRQTAKWLTISLATLGGVLIAGSQLSDIGKLQPSSSRFAVAIAGGGIAAAAAVTILALAIWVAITPLVSLKQLVTQPPAGLGGTLTDPQFLGGKSKVEDLDTAYTAALKARNSAFAMLKHQYNDQNSVAAAAADAEFVSLSDTVNSLIAAVAYMRLAYRWRRAGAALLACGVLAAAGIGAFAWAANPPDNVQASMATPSVLTAPERITLMLTTQGQVALRDALGPDCPVTSALRALSLGETQAGTDVLIQQKGCKTVRFIAVADWASVQQR
jgi:nicotinamide riboside transporter PnuC